MHHNEKKDKSVGFWGCSIRSLLVKIRKLDFNPKSFLCCSCAGGKWHQHDWCFRHNKYSEDFTFYRQPAGKIRVLWHMAVQWKWKLHAGALQCYLSMEDVSTHELNIQPGSPAHSHTGMHRKCGVMSICDLRRAHMRNFTLHGDTRSNNWWFGEWSASELEMFDFTLTQRSVICEGKRAQRCFI